MVARKPAMRRWSRTGLAVLGVLGLGAAVGAAAPAPADAEPAPEAIHLVRVTYKLKAATSEAVAALLKDNVKSVVLEIKTEGDAFTVTTTPEAQEAVGQFIALLQGKPLSPAPGFRLGGPFGPGPGGTGGTGFFPVPGGTGPRPGGTFGPGPGGTGGPFSGPPPGNTAPPPPAGANPPGQ